MKSKLNKALTIKKKKEKAIKVIEVYKYFIKKVKTNGDWDLKRKTKWKLKSRHYFIFRGEKYFRNDALGNIHFGYTGAVLFSKAILCAGAGVYQIKSGTSSWKYTTTWGDDPYDNYMIKLGYDYYKEDNGKITRSKDIVIKKF